MSCTFSSYAFPCQCAMVQVLWPWSGFVALFIRVREAGRQFKGIASGHLNFTVVSPGQVGRCAYPVHSLCSPSLYAPCVSVLPLRPACALH